MPLQDYHHDPLSRISSEGAVFGSIIDADSYSRDSGGRPSKSQRLIMWGGVCTSIPQT